MLDRDVTSLVPLIALYVPSRPTLISDDTKLLTVPEVATQLRITPKTVHRWLREGKLQGVRLGGKNVGWRIAQGDVDRLVSLPISEVPRA